MLTCKKRIQCNIQCIIQQMPHGSRGETLWQRCKVEHFFRTLSTLSFSRGKKETPLADARRMQSHIERSSHRKRACCRHRQCASPFDNSNNFQLNAHTRIKIVQSVARRPFVRGNQIIFSGCHYFGRIFSTNSNHLCRGTALIDRHGSLRRRKTNIET